MKPFKKLFPAVLTFIFALSLTFSGAAAAAASMQWSASQQAAVDRATASDAALRSKLGSLYSRFKDLQSQLQQVDQSISSLHYKNEETQSSLTKQIKVIDADKIARLEQAVKQTKDKYKPILTMYTTLNQQITTANKLKNKQLSSALKTQVDTMKLAVQMAKMDIQNKEQALASAKAQRSSAQKKIRGILAGADSVRIKIKAEKSTATILNKNVSPLWKGVTQAVKVGDAKKIHTDLNTLVNQLLQIQSQKQKILSLENQISGILQNAKSQLPST
ncbi:hypothetical protein MUG84_01890 [Paenibacillus sp. KQZ6P-2]|uniref:Chromosome partition protein Smc n=1 Tax=Paenibacillus mangrovi TaxID=2931978 RepID=A0A9X1WKP6_9BACL|nr:hypothetical protein [Paenibacillus mangrovi]MCJ8010491.1 hypothetical protein [Paenibacillus mangrovi]